MYESFPSKLLKMFSLGYPILLIAEPNSSVRLTHADFAFSLCLSTFQLLSPYDAHRKATISFHNYKVDKLKHMHSVLNLFS